jgi:hypothetical protein
MGASNSWADFAAVFRRTRPAYQEHEAAKADLKKLVPDDAREAIGHGLRAKRSKSGAVSGRNERRQVISNERDIQQGGLHRRKTVNLAVGPKKARRLTALVVICGGALAPPQLILLDKRKTN